MNGKAVLETILSELPYIPMYLIALPIVQRKGTWKGCLIYTLVGVLFDLIIVHFFSEYNALSFFVAISLILCQLFCAFGLRGKRLLKCMAAQLVCIMVSGAVCSWLNGVLFGFEYAARSAELKVKPWEINVVDLVFLTVFWLALRNVLSLIRNEKKQPPDWLPLARAGVMFISTVIAGMILLRDVTRYTPEEKIFRVMGTFLLTAVMALTVLGTLTQEVRNLQLRRWGETLEREKAVNDALVRDLRVFRHNIINTLQAFRGVIANGSTEDQKAYYENLARELATLNNENALALQRLNSPALAALLMEKLRRARESGLAIYLYTKGTPALRGAMERELAGIAGVLVDNAIEAAMGSEAGVVRVQLAGTDTGTELSVLNTYPEDMDAEAFLSGRPVSTKAGHTGLGLLSVEEKVRKNPRLSFIRQQRGRYIECVVACRE